jgi:nicotinamide-nucleotide amidase
MQAEIVAIGDELTSGQRLDTNSQWLSQRLGELGIAVQRHITVADDLKLDTTTIRDAIDRADVVLVSGGLGPTADDLTREALAAALGVELQESSEALAHITQIFAARGRPMPERNRLQALFPAGSNMISNPHGTAPGIYATAPRTGGGLCHVFALPGVPAEMYEMWQASVAPTIRGLRSEPGVLHHRVIKLFGAGESQVEALLPTLIHRDRVPRVGITASGATISLRIAAFGPNEQACLKAMESTVEEIYTAAGRFIFGEGEHELEHVLLDILQQRGASLGTDETFTGGLLASWLSAADPSGTFYRGGMIRPAPNGLSALPRASAIREQFGTHFGLAVAGATDNQVEVAWHEGQRGESLFVSRGGPPGVEAVRIAKSAINLLRLHLVNESGDQK